MSLSRALRAARHHKNASAMLFVAAKVSQFSLLPQGRPERHRRVLGMVATMDAEGFGNCTVIGSCAAVCPKEVSLDFITRMNRDYLAALVHEGIGRSGGKEGGGS